MYIKFEESKERAKEKKNSSLNFSVFTNSYSRGERLYLLLECLFGNHNKIQIKKNISLSI